MAQIDVVKKELRKSALCFRNTFSTPEGMKTLKNLKQEFSPVAIVSSTSHETVVNAAQRDVVEYIETMIKLTEDDYDG